MATTMTPAPKTSGGLTSWFGRDPFHSMREEFDAMMKRMTEGWNGNIPAEERLRFPSLDLSETDGELQLKMDVPGIKPEEVDIELSGNTLRIKGEHKEEKEEKGKTYHRIERQTGSFFRSVELPCAVDEENIAAECKDGVLTVTLPKSQEAVARKVKVKG